jgi:tripartite ATP-independent transporter DctM subunit
MAPEMIRRGYSKYLSLGPIMGVGGLAVIIPPSALTVLLATLGQTDVGALLIAGVIPGFVLASMYGVLIWAWVVIDPKAAPPYEVQSITTREKLRIFFIDVIPMVAIIVFSVLIMLVGWCTPTEAAALGAVSVIVLAACYGEMTWQAFRKSLDGALRVTVMAFLVIFGSATFGQVLAFSGASSGLLNWAISFQVTPIEMLYIMIGVIIFLGSFMDPLSKMLLTAPIFFPLAKSLGFDLTWFGLIMLLSLEMGYTMPPFGLLLFVMKGVSPPGTRMRDIYLAGMPFIACVVLLILLVIYVPPLATWLPAVSH